MPDDPNTNKQVDRSNATQSIQSNPQKSPPLRDDFSQYMTPSTVKKGPETDGTIHSTKLPSPIEIAAQQSTTTPRRPPTIQGVHQQFQDLDHALNQAQAHVQLQQKLEKQTGRQLKNSQREMIKGRLQSIQGHIQAVAQHMGRNIPENPLQTTHWENPATQYLRLLVGSQKSLNLLSQTLAELGSSDQFDPKKLLLINAKLFQAYQSVDFFSASSGKFIDMLRTIFNIQI